MNTFRRKLLTIFTAALMLISSGTLVSCKKNKAKDTAESSQTTTGSPVVTTTAPAGDESVPQQPEEDIYRRDKKVSYLSCYKGSAAAPVIISAGGGKLISITNTFGAESNSEITTIQTIDIVQDKIEAEKTYESYVSLSSEYDGGVILEDSAAMEYIFVDSDLNEVSRFDPEVFFGKFSYDGEKYYFVSDGDLWQEDVATKKISRIPESVEVCFESYIPYISKDGKYAVIDHWNSNSDEYAPAAVRIELDTGEITLLTDQLDSAAYYGDCIYGEQLSKDGDPRHDSFYLINGSDCVKFMQDKYDMMTLNDSEYIICLDTSTANDAMYYETPPAVFVGKFGENVLELSNILPADSNEYLSSYIYLPEEKLIAFCKSDDETSCIGIAEPELFDFTEEIKGETVELPVLLDKSISEKYLADSVIPEVPEYLAEERQKADRLEEEYGVKIYISSQCKNMVKDDKSYNCTDEELDSKSEKELIDESLEDLEKNFKKYPEGFFKQFKNVLGNGGMRICLTGTINDNFSAAFAVNTNEWYNVVLDVRYDTEINFPHEAWHSIESFISQKDPSLLTDEQWQSFNPQGFEYLTNYEEYYNADNSYCIYDDNNGCYFYDPYCKINSREDKARLMEVIMCPGLYDTEEFVKSEHIKDKLSCMCDAVRQTFDTTGWGDVYWERYN